MISYVLGATSSGPMIMCRWDDRGVANELLETSKHEQEEIDLVVKTVRQVFGNGPIDCVDGGANVGCWTVQLSRRLGGEVHSFEPQKRLYYALAGNIALNNCFRATPHLAALSYGIGSIRVPQLSVTSPSAFSTLSLNNPPGGNDPRESVPTEAIDNLNRPFKLLKLDIEGMELAALQGAKYTIQTYRPIVFAEVWTHQPGEVLGLLPRYRETLVSHDRRNAIYVPEEYHVDI